MRRFLHNLFRDFRTTSTARGGRRVPRRAALQVEGLEDRRVLSTAVFNPHSHTLVVNADPGSIANTRQITFQDDQHHPTKLDVLDDGTRIGQFTIAAIKHVAVNVAGLDAVTVDDSINNLPFSIGTDVSLLGSGSDNSLNLTGTRDFTHHSDGETYTAGNGAEAGSLTLRGITFEFSSAIGSVTDLVKTSAPLVVKAFGQKVTLSGSDGVSQTLSGLSNGGAGDTLTYGGKDHVNLEMLSANASATLNATAAAAGEQFFVVDLFGNNGSLQINATPSTVDTSIVAGGEQTNVFLAANSGPVDVAGISSTTVNLGAATADGLGLSTTADIEANVTVSGVGLLVVADNGNNATQEIVTVTESTISATGLFGNDAVVVNYSSIGKLQFLAGEAFEKYAIGPSTSTAAFSNQIEIDGATTGSLFINVGVDASSNLDLVLKNANPADNSARLFFTALGATLNPVHPPIGDGSPDLSGSEVAFFPDGGHSVVFYSDFSDIIAIDRLPNANPGGSSGESNS